MSKHTKGNAFTRINNISGTTTLEFLDKQETDFHTSNWEVVSLYTTDLNYQGQEWEYDVSSNMQDDEDWDACHQRLVENGEGIASILYVCHNDCELPENAWIRVWETDYVLLGKTQAQLAKLYYHFCGMSGNNRLLADDFKQAAAKVAASCKAQYNCYPWSK